MRNVDLMMDLKNTKLEVDITLFFVFESIIILWQVSAKIKNKLNYHQNIVQF